MNKIKNFIVTPVGIVVTALVMGLVAVALVYRVTAVGKVVTGASNG